MPEIRIQLTECVLILNVVPGNEGGDATFVPDQFAMADNDDRRQKWNDWNTSLDVFMSFCLKMAIAGIDLTTPQFVQVLNDQFDAIADAIGDQSDEDYTYSLLGDLDDEDEDEDEDDPVGDLVALAQSRGLDFDSLLEKFPRDISPDRLAKRRMTDLIELLIEGGDDPEWIEEIIES